MSSKIRVFFLATAAAGGLLVLAPIADASLEPFHLPKELLVEACALVVLLAHLRDARTLDRVERVGVALVAGTLVSTAFAIEIYTALRLAALTLAGIVLLFHARRLDPATHLRVERVVLVAATAVAIVALLETFGVVRGLSGHGRAPGATLGQRNLVAHVAVLVLPFAWMRATSPGSRMRWAHLAAAAVLTAAVIATRSRAGWLALAAGFVIALLGARTAARRLELAATTLLAVAAVVLVRPALAWRSGEPYLQTWRNLLDASGGSGAGRLLTYDASLDLVPRAPLFGVGPGNWTIAYPLVAPTGDPGFDLDAAEHSPRLLASDAVSWVVERGMVGALVAATFVLVIARDDVLGRADPARRGAILGTFAALAIVGTLDSVLTLAPTVAVLAVLLAVPDATSGVDPVVRAPAHSAPSPRVSPRSALSLVGGVLLTLAVAHRALSLAALDARASQRASVEDLENARAIDPGDYASRAALVEIRARARDCVALRALAAETRALRPHHRLPHAADVASRSCSAP